MAFEWVSFIGDSLIALALSICFAYWSLGLRRRLGMGDLLNLTNRCFPPLLGILLVVGAGGTFNDMLVGDGWEGAGRRTGAVAEISTAGIVLPLLGLRPECGPLAIGR